MLVMVQLDGSINLHQARVGGLLAAKVESHLASWKEWAHLACMRLLTGRHLQRATLEPKGKLLRSRQLQPSV